MSSRRCDRLNSLLKEVISEVVFRDVKNPNISELLTITKVDISKDLHHAKVYVSVIGDEKEKKLTLTTLNQAAGFIGSSSSKKVTMRFFPHLKFILDESVDKHMRIDSILKEIDESRTHTES
ncbi:MAG: 30S ribosome-binding factor RbfA [Rhabdochlamydiaceae bacterium]|nr:30S ribosome-binding factor RbfA [Candidatus Amphrikana amoebophyrae]